MSRRSTLLYGENDGIAAVESFTGAQLVTGLSTTALNAGVLFIASDVDAALAAAGSFDTLFRIPADILVYAVMSGQVGGDSRIEIFEAPTVTADGTPLATVNRNREPPVAASQVLAFVGPTVTSPGTLLIEQILVGGPDSKAGGTAFKVADEWRLNPGTDYLLRITNITGSAHPVSTITSWLEYSGPPVPRVL